MRGELDDLNAEAEMTHDELLAKYGLNKEEYAEQKVPTGFLYKRD